MIEYIFSGICFFFCLIHFLIDFFVSRSNGKKINKLCDKCHLPVFDGKDHDCALSSEQLQRLVEFVKSLKEIK